MQHGGTGGAPGHSRRGRSGIPGGYTSHFAAWSLWSRQKAPCCRHRATQADITARSDGLDYVVGRRDYGGTAYGWALEDSESFAKVLIARSDHRILGAHVMGPQAATLVQPLIQAMQFDQTADQVAHEVFYIHPALTEVIENALIDGLDQLA